MKSYNIYWILLAFLLSAPLVAADSHVEQIARACIPQELACYNNDETLFDFYYMDSGKMPQTRGEQLDQAVNLLLDDSTPRSMHVPNGYSSIYEYEIQGCKTFVRQYFDLKKFTAPLKKATSGTSLLQLFTLPTSRSEIEKWELLAATAEKIWSNKKTPKEKPFKPAPSEIKTDYSQPPVFEEDACAKEIRVATGASKQEKASKWQTIRDIHWHLNTHRTLPAQYLETCSAISKKSFNNGALSTIDFIKSLITPHDKNKQTDDTLLLPCSTENAHSQSDGSGLIAYLQTAAICESEPTEQKAGECYLKMQQRGRLFWEAFSCEEKMRIVCATEGMVLGIGTDAAGGSFLVGGIGSLLKTAGISTYQSLLKYLKFRKTLRILSHNTKAAFSFAKTLGSPALETYVKLAASASKRATQFVIDHPKLAGQLTHSLSNAKDMALFASAPLRYTFRGLDQLTRLGYSATEKSTQSLAKLAKDLRKLFDPKYALMPDGKLPVLELVLSGGDVVRFGGEAASDAASISKQEEEILRILTREAANTPPKISSVLAPIASKTHQLEELGDSQLIKLALGEKKLFGIFRKAAKPLRYIEDQNGKLWIVDNQLVAPAPGTPWILSQHGKNEVLYVKRAGVLEFDTGARQFKFAQDYAQAWTAEEWARVEQQIGSLLSKAELPKGSSAWVNEAQGKRPPAGTREMLEHCNHLLAPQSSEGLRAALIKAAANMSIGVVVVGTQEFLGANRLKNLDGWKIVGTDLTLTGMNAFAQGIVGNKNATHQASALSKIFSMYPTTLAAGIVPEYLFLREVLDDKGKAEKIFNFELVYQGIKTLLIIPVDDFLVDRMVKNAVLQCSGISPQYVVPDIAFRLAEGAAWCAAYYTARKFTTGL